MKVRNPITCILLSLVTCGIYGFYWRYCMAKEVVAFKDESESPLVNALLMMFLPFVGYFMIDKKLGEACAAKGIEHKDNSILYLILGLVCSIVDDYLLQAELNKLAEAE